jgi:curli biogenesis system outer membrane secretion channel CsgG
MLSAEVVVVSAEIKDIFPAQQKYYAREPVGYLILSNSGKKSVKINSINSIIKNFMFDFTKAPVVKNLAPGDMLKVPVRILLPVDSLKITEDTPMQCKVVVVYNESGTEKRLENIYNITILSRNALIWDDTKKIGSFITPKDPAVKEAARKIVAAFKEEDTKYYSRNVYIALWVFETLRDHGLVYNVDPLSSYSKVSGKENVVDYVLYPRELLECKVGDCDDLTALYTSILENLGIQTALITTPGHIFMAFNSGEPLSAAFKYETKGRRYIPYQGEIWIPVEITSLRKNFLHAWKIAIKEYHNAKRKNNAEFIPVSLAWEKYAPVALPKFDSEKVSGVKKKNVAVFDFEIQGVSKAEGKGVSDMFETKLVESDAFTVLQRENMDIILNEQSHEVKGCTSSKCAIEIGKMLNIDYIIMGNFFKINVQYFINIKLVSVETGEIVESFNSHAFYIENLNKEIHNMVLKLLSTQGLRFNSKKRNKIIKAASGISSSVISTASAILAAAVIEPRPWDVSFAEFSLLQSPDAAALGGTFAARDDDLSLVVHNPAAIGNRNLFSFFTGYRHYEIMETFQAGIVVLDSFVRIAPFLSYQMISYNSFSTWESTKKNIASFIVGSAVQKSFDNLSVGISPMYFYSVLFGTVLSFDAGLIYHFTENSKNFLFNAGFVLNRVKLYNNGDWDIPFSTSSGIVFSPLKKYFFLTFDFRTSYLDGSSIHIGTTLFPQWIIRPSGGLSYNNGSLQGSFGLKIILRKFLFTSFISLSQNQKIGFGAGVSFEK